KALWPAHVLLHLTIYLILITAPMVYLLGQTVPITMNLIKDSRVGLIGGRVLHMSTIGSFLGAVLTSVLLLHFLGVAASVFFNYCALTLLVVALSIQIPQQWWKMILLVGFAVVIYKFNIQFEQ